MKAPRHITHVRRLRDIEEPLANFFASGLFQLREKLGPILWQFPPSLRFDAERFGRFLELLPADNASAKACARHCSGHMEKTGSHDLGAGRMEEPKWASGIAPRNHARGRHGA
ncbi:hypothetical protein D3C81_1944890 [compost metagenome]